MSQKHFDPSQNRNGDKNGQMANPNWPLFALFGSLHVWIGWINEKKKTESYKNMQHKENIEPWENWSSMPHLKAQATCISLSNILIIHWLFTCNAWITTINKTCYQLLVTLINHSIFPKNM